MKKTIVSGSSDTEFASSEERLVVALMALKFIPIRIESEGMICTYFFDKSQVISIVDRISCGNIDDIKLSLSDLWNAQNIWRVNLSRARFNQ